MQSKESLPGPIEGQREKIGQVRFHRVLGIETSCDDTSVALVSTGGFVEALCTANQDVAHRPFGGVVPEIASRNHTLNILPLIERAMQLSGSNWSDIDAIAVTNRPGLVGALLVGLVTAKSLAFAKNIPFLGVNHIEGHLLAPFLQDARAEQGWKASEGFSFPYLALAVSGGHTQLVWVRGLGDYAILGHTLDDAAGEAFDKFAKMIGLGFPGGVAVDKLSKSGNVQAYSFPRGLLNSGDCNFSFSGLKAAAVRWVHGQKPEVIAAEKENLCASFQEAIVDTLISKLDLAFQRMKNEFGVNRVVLTGGVSANSRLRERAQAWAHLNGAELTIPPIRFCTDNAAMIGIVGLMRLNRGEISPLDLGPSPHSLPLDFADEPLACP